ncbi:MAG: hypothetical protein KIT56_02175 [Gammaproteobacteria bacterium]|nr:hypothetical protein [Gammaproteobacteria bacterium]MCW5582688.1 hypothetical protein [Gammaproteobacteria bacterium]
MQRNTITLVGSDKEKEEFLTQLSTMTDILSNSVLNQSKMIGVDIKIITNNGTEFAIWNVSNNERFSNTLNKHLQNTNAVIYLNPTEKQCNIVKRCIDENVVIIDSRDYASVSLCFNDLQEKLQKNHTKENIEKKTKENTKQKTTGQETTKTDSNIIPAIMSSIITLFGQPPTLPANAKETQRELHDYHNNNL